MSFSVPEFASFKNKFIFIYKKIAMSANSFFDVLPKGVCYFTYQNTEYLQISSIY